MTTSPEDRPPVAVDYHTADLPPLPQRDYLIPAERWVEAPSELLELGADFGVSLVAYKRRIGRYLLRPGVAASGGRVRRRAPPPATWRSLPTTSPSGTCSGFDPTARARGSAPTAKRTSASAPGKNGFSHECGRTLR